jgi:hypothetical protein
LRWFGGLLRKRERGQCERLRYRKEHNEEAREQADATSGGNFVCCVLFLSVSSRFCLEKRYPVFSFSISNLLLVDPGWKCNILKTHSAHSISHSHRGFSPVSCFKVFVVMRKYSR